MLVKWKRDDEVNNAGGEDRETTGREVDGETGQEFSPLSGKGRPTEC